MGTAFASAARTPPDNPDATVAQQIIAAIGKYREGQRVENI
jgi:hypothetical protein